jgi:acyl dehydratase
VNPAAEGTTYPPAPFVVDPVRVAAFRNVFGQTHGVPPTFATAAEFATMPSVIEDPNLGLDFTRVIHGSQGYRHHRPMREGETLTATTRIESIRRKGTNGFLILVTEIADEDGRPVCTARSSLIERGGAAG